MGLRSEEHPPRAVRRTEQQVSALVLDRMGGPQLEINAAVLTRFVPVARAFAPRLYQRGLRARARKGAAP
jgi:hypothetical protein